MIFLDMDGVLCDFVSAAFSAHGVTFKPDEYPRGEFACEKIIGCTSSEFWRRIDFAGEYFWENLEPYPWAKSLFEELQLIDEVIIATSPSRSPASYAGKRRWLRHMGMHGVQSMFGSRKYLMAKPGRVLIDDGEHNVKPWIREGGQAVLVPQPWNHAEPVADMVEHVLSQLPVAV
jgi:5'(3')-deoxyribonucleotidase